MPQLIEYVRTLSEEIGPRPTGTDAEHQAAQWLERAFAAHGLETEMQTFDAPRTYSWAYVLYNLLTIASAVVAGPKILSGRLVWLAFAVSAITAFFMWSDLSTRWGLTRLMPKGPSQNVIARHVPRARRGEKLHKIVIVAHYDTTRASLAFAPGLVKHVATTIGLMKAATFVTPVLVFVAALPFTDKAQPWLWYATLVPAAYLVLPLLANVYREIALGYVPGANDNASGVAAMLGVMERLVPAPDSVSLVTSEFSAVRRGPAAAYDAGVVPDGAELRYDAPETSAELPGDFSWAEPVKAEPQPRGSALFEIETVEFAAVGEHAPSPADFDAGSSSVWNDSTGGMAAVAPDVLPPEIAQPVHDAAAAEPVHRRGLFGGRKKKRSRHEEAGSSDWLGVGEDFDARKAGRDIGSWDNFGGDDSDDDGLGWKGGWAGDDPISDPEYAASEAARIRRRITESVDRELTEKEVWFVATGAEEAGMHGMQTLLRDHADELADALIINIIGCGAGSLYWASAEGVTRRYRASARLVSLVRRVSRETETLIKPRLLKGLNTDATPALARGFKAITLMASSTNGVPNNWHWKTDTADGIDESLLETTADFVAAIVREA